MELSQWAHNIALTLPQCYRPTLPKHYFLVNLFAAEDFINIFLGNK